MSLKYHVVQKKDMSQGAAPDAKLYYGQIRKGDDISFDKVCAKISLISTATKGDVQNVIAGLTEVLSEHLEMGQSIHLGELGIFRMVAGSRGSETQDDFDASLFKKGRIRFYPGATLRNVQDHATFDKLTVVEKTIECDKIHEND
jgi:predicted histone-like DNA-binding protein